MQGHHIFDPPEFRHPQFALDSFISNHGFPSWSSLVPVPQHRCPTSSDLSSMGAFKPLSNTGLMGRASRLPSPTNRACYKTQPRGTATHGNLSSSSSAFPQCWDRHQEVLARPAVRKWLTGWWSGRRAARGSPGRWARCWLRNPPLSHPGCPPPGWVSASQAASFEGAVALQEVLNILWG